MKWERIALIVLMGLAVSGVYITDPGNTNEYPPLTLTCSTNTALSGSYAVNQDNMTTLNAMMLYYLNGGSAILPAGSLLDVNNNYHKVTSVIDLKNVHKGFVPYWTGIKDYQNQLLANQPSPTLPSSTYTGC